MAYTKPFEATEPPNPPNSSLMVKDHHQDSLVQDHQDSSARFREELAAWYQCPNGVLVPLPAPGEAVACGDKT
jgi:hypothetical protein